MQTELKRQKAKPLPTLLTKSDAMLFAADQLDQHISNLELAAIFADVFNKKPLEVDDEKGREALDDIRTIASGIVDKDIQTTAMRDAAKEIRAMANEAKLADARAARQGIAISV